MILDLDMRNKLARSRADCQQTLGEPRSVGRCRHFGAPVPLLSRDARHLPPFLGKKAQLPLPAPTFPKMGKVAEGRKGTSAQSTRKNEFPLSIHGEGARG